MRVHYWLIAILVLLSISCKKETQTISPPVDKSAATTEVAYSTPQCSGNIWQLDDIYYGELNDHDYVSYTPPMVYNNKIYVPDYEAQEVRIYDGDSWQTRASLVPTYILEETNSFTIGSKGYIVNTASKECWEYNFATNYWSKKANFPGARRWLSASFAIGTKGYIAGGGNMVNGSLKDVWAFNQLTNSWSGKAQMIFPLYGPTGFSIGDKGYVVLGQTPSGETTSLFEYDPVSNGWTGKALFPGTRRREAIAFVIAGKAYVGGGRPASGEKFNDFYRYNPASDAWVRVADMPLADKTSIYGFALNSKGYGVFDLGSSNYAWCMLSYTPQYCTPGTSP